MPETKPHPAKFTDTIMMELAKLYDQYGSPGVVLDPFAGTGRIHTIGDIIEGFTEGIYTRPAVRTIGVEIEPEWAAHDPRTIIGNALDLPFATASIDGVITSPVYGNRMSDHHDAKDASKRHTYRHYIGRPLHTQNAGQLQWGPRYRDFHMQAWEECHRVLRPGAPAGMVGMTRGLMLVNVSNHIRKGEEVDVVHWHVNALIELGFAHHWTIKVPTPRQRHGANGKLRVDHEAIIVARKVDRAP